ncbi:MAG: hypothetical protein EZS28_034313 [Streblomastix strix]|uniref:Uncharacterized protein n=1 Tax=Streblomastix strix TaxID=222440 RepID=A0A5J4UJJ5_9EUKA|nr:MAG: hypothetical protein EZS28_034313 [Streblomastix strix]
MEAEYNLGFLEIQQVVEVHAKLVMVKEVFQDIGGVVIPAVLVMGLEKWIVLMIQIKLLNVLHAKELEYLNLISVVAQRVMEEEQYLHQKIVLTEYNAQFVKDKEQLQRNVYTFVEHAMDMEIEQILVIHQNLVSAMHAMEQEELNLIKKSVKIAMEEVKDLHQKIILTEYNAQFVKEMEQLQRNVYTFVEHAMDMEIEQVFRIHQNLVIAMHAMEQEELNLIKKSAKHAMEEAQDYLQKTIQKDRVAQFVEDMGQFKNKKKIMMKNKKINKIIQTLLKKRNKLMIKNKKRNKKMKMLIRN